MDVVGVMAAYAELLCVCVDTPPRVRYTHTHTHTHTMGQNMLP